MTYMKFTILVHPSLVIITIYLVCLNNAWESREEIKHFHYMTYIATPLHKNPSPWGHEISNFGRPFHDHHYYILGLSDLRLGVEKNIFKEIIIFTTWQRTSTRTPAPGVIKFTSLEDLSLVIITSYLGWLIYACE